MSDLFLSESEVQELTHATGRQRITKLRELGRSFIVRRDGTVCVIREGQFRRDNLPHDDAALLSVRQIISRAQPVKRVSAVYFLVSGSAIVYVGQSTDLWARLAAHMRGATFHFDSYHYIKVAKGRLREVEAAYIKALKPIANRLGGPERNNLEPFNRVA